MKKFYDYVMGEVQNVTDREFIKFCVGSCVVIMVLALAIMVYLKFKG